MKEEGTLWLVFQNVESLPKRRHGDKNRRLHEFCSEREVDVLGIVETNRCWHKLDPQDRLPDRFRGWWESLHTSVAYNRVNKDAGQFQWGGTALLSFDWAAHRVCESGRDPSDLGRWTWT